MNIFDVSCKPVFPISFVITLFTRIHFITDVFFLYMSIQFFFAHTSPLTCVTFEFFVTNMNLLNMLFQSVLIKENFTAYVTLVLFFSNSMLVTQMVLQMDFFFVTWSAKVTNKVMNVFMPWHGELKFRRRRKTQSLVNWTSLLAESESVY